MILVGNQRSGGKNLALHLMKPENDHVEVHEIRGFVSDNLQGAFNEAYAISRATRCQQYLFSLSLNPPQNEDVSVEQFESAIERIEDKLGLTGQPRAIVFHEKEGRRHCHAVWSRIDGEDLKAIPLSFSKLKLRDMSRELYLEHGWQMPRGLMNSQERDPRNFTLAEWQQAKRAGQNPRIIKEALQDCWAVSDGRKTFEHALEERGFYLAKGDRRGHVVLDHQGEVYGLARSLSLKAKDVRARLGDEAALPSVDETKKKIAEQMTPAIRKHIEESRTAFQQRMATVAHSKMILVQRQRHERKMLLEQQKARWDAETKQRSQRLPHGLKGIWSRLTGSYARIREENEAETEAAKQRDRAERQSVVKRQLAERRTLQKSIEVIRKRQAQQLMSLRQDVRLYMRMRETPMPAPEQRPRRTRQRSRERGPTRTR